jgi:ribonuclease E
MKKEMLINVLQPEEIRIAIVEDGVLEELYVERTSHESYVGNIYKGRIVNIEPSIQAAFVDFGVGRNGFLHVSDVEPAYYKHLEQGRDGGRRGRDRGRGDRDRGERGPRRPRREPQPEYADVREDIEDEILETSADVVEVSEASTDVQTGFAEEISPPFEDAAKNFLPEEVPAPLTEPVWDEETSITPVAAPPEGAELAAEMEAEAGGDAPSGRGRRRGRGRGRGRRGRGDKGQEERAEGAAAPDAPVDSKPADPPGSAEPGETSPPRDWPRLMESTEHRTAEGDKKSPDLPDEELSFSMRPPQETRQDGRPEPREELPSYEAPLETAPPMPPEPRAALFEEPRPEFPGDLDHPFEEPRESSDDALERAFEEPEEELAPHFEQDESLPPPRRGPRDERRNDRRGGGRRDDRRPSGGPRRGPMGRPGMGRPKPLIQDIFKRGQEVLVQVIKEGIGTKGPTLSTYISIAGRYLVLMPGLNRIGVSRKIIDEEARRRLREILNDLEPPRGLGFIIRTAGIDRNKKELQRDLAYLSRLWQVVVRRIKKTKSPCEIYQESDMITRTIRDIFTSEIDSITVDEKNAYEHAKEFLQIVMPRYASRINFYDSTEPMFHRYGIETEIARIQQRHVPLPAGGSIVIDQTEALVAIDVNSGNFRADGNAEETAYQMNLQAAKEIARQLRLRDLGGVIVNDFIDMREDRHRRGVEKALRDAIKRDRARTKILRISQFGIIEMTRQRIRPSLKRSVYQDCPHCLGTGQVKTCESMSIDVMRFLQLATHREHVRRIEIRVHEDVALYLLNRKRKEVAQLETAGDKQVNIKNTPGVSPEFLEFLCYDAIDNEVKFMPYDEPPPRRHRSRR